MKLGFLLAVLFAASAAAHDGAAHDKKKDCNPPKTAQAAVETTTDHATYGAPMPASAGNAVTISQAAANPAAVTGRAAAFSGRITDVCQAQGCWMVLEHDGAFARVMMHDHSFTVPKDAKGDAVVYGELKVKTLSADEVEHLTKEGKKPASTIELTIDATSVRIAQG